MSYWEWESPWERRELDEVRQQRARSPGDRWEE